jgi:peptidoglycan/LPS O-acetylase OafA/YrhL
MGGVDGVPQQRSLAEGLAGHANSFGVIRLILATIVIFCHAFPTGGWGLDPVTYLTRGQENSGGIAVLGFFAISGYLIAKSGLHSDGLQFLWRRVLRIFPAFYVSLIAAAFLVGPIAWLMVGRPLVTYFNFGPQGPFAYLLHDADLWMRQYGVNDVFAATTPYGRVAGPVFNGSLWTLTYEFGAYLIIFVLVITGILKRAKFMVPVITGFYLIAQIVHEVTPDAGRSILPTFGDNYRVSLPLIFLFGACLAVYSRKVPIDWRLGIFAGLVATVTLAAGGLTVLGFPAIAYFVIWLAAVLPARLHWIGQKNDYSYGMYVYGFLVEQFTAFLGWYKWGYIPWVTVVVVITAGCAWLSWHGVEKRALQLKDVGPGRGFRYWNDRVRTAGERRRAARASAGAQKLVPRGDSLQTGDVAS